MNPINITSKVIGTKTPNYSANIAIPDLDIFSPIIINSIARYPKNPPIINKSKL